MVRSQDVSTMTIAGLARRCGVGVETVRFYQRRGLLDTPDRPAGGGIAGGVRRYATSDVRRLRFVRSAQAAGFTLEEIGQLLRLDASDDRATVRDMASARIAELDRRIADMQAARAALSRLTQDCSRSDSGPCPILLAFEASGTPG